MPTIALRVLFAISMLAGAVVAPPGASAAAKSRAAPVPAAQKADDGAGFRVVSEDLSASTSTRFAAVVLAHRVVETEIVRIADLVRAKEKTPFEKTVVNFYLPGMKIGHGAWAVATFNPTLKVSIIGLRLDEEQAAIAEAGADRRALVGVWLTAPPAAPGRLAIYKEGSRTFSEWRLRNGQKSIEELAESRDPRGRRLSPVTGGSDYYLLGWNGDLELRDANSVIATAERLPGFGDAAAAKTPVKPVTKAAQGHARPRPARAVATTASASSADAGAALSKQVFKN